MISIAEVPEPLPAPEATEIAPEAADSPVNPPEEFMTF